MLFLRKIRMYTFSTDSTGLLAVTMSPAVALGTGVPGTTM